MFTEFKLGDTVKVWPRPGLLVQAHGNTPGRFLGADGEEVTWSTWHFELARAGSIVFTDPTETHTLAEHVDGSAAKAALDAHQAEIDAAKAKEEADKQAAADAAKATAAPAAPQAAPSSSATAPTTEAPASATKENV